MNSLSNSSKLTTDLNILCLRVQLIRKKWENKTSIMIPQEELTTMILLLNTVS